MWDLPRPGLEPVCPALAGGFLTTAPPGRPCFLIFKMPSKAVAKCWILHKDLVTLALVSCGCYIKLSWIWWPKTTKIHSLTLLEAESLTSISLGQNDGVDRSEAPLEALGDNSFLTSSSFWWLPSSSDCGHCIQPLPLWWHCFFLLHLYSEIFCPPLE